MNSEKQLSNNLSLKEEASNQVKEYYCAKKACGKSFKAKSLFEAHIKSHDQECLLTCSFENCGKTFMKYSRLLKHQLSHTEQKSFKSNECQAAFTQYKLSDSSEKPFKCELCMKAFSTKSNLKQHQQIHKEATSRPIYECSRCSRTYRYQNSLSKHMKSHIQEDFAAELCMNISEEKGSQLSKIEDQTTSNTVKVESDYDPFQNCKKVKKTEFDDMTPTPLLPFGSLEAQMNMNSLELALINDYLVRAVTFGPLLIEASLQRKRNSLLLQLVEGNNCAPIRCSYDKNCQPEELDFSKQKARKNSNILNILREDFFGESSDTICKDLEDVTIKVEASY